MTEKRKGPRMLPLAFECDGCEHLKSEYYCVQGDSGFEYWCMHGGKRRNKSDDIARDCPLLPVRRVIGTCAECKSWRRVEFDEDLQEDIGTCERAGDNRHTFGAGYGCIVWEQQ